MAPSDLNGHVRDSEDTELKRSKVSVVIPAKNEAHNLWQVLPELAQDDCEVILVDGNSTDDTVSVAKRLRPNIIIIGQTRKGKGNALACGFAVARGDFIVMLDADGSADPAEIPRFVDALEKGADFAKGSRFLPGGGSNDISRFRRSGNYSTEPDRQCRLWNEVHRSLLWVQCLSSPVPLRDRSRLAKR